LTDSDNGDIVAMQRIRKPLGNLSKRPSK